MRKNITKLLALSFLMIPVTGFSAAAQERDEIKTIPVQQIIQKTRITTTHEFYDGSIQELIQNDPRFSMLARAFDVAQLDAMMDGELKYTLFAPSNDALTDLSQEQFNALYNQKKKMRQFLFRHMTRGQFDLGKLVGESRFVSLSGDTIDVDHLQGLEIEEHALIRTNIVTENGVVHIIDGVIPSGDIDI